MSDFRIEDDGLIRERPLYIGSDMIGYEKTLVITKEAFLACYNKWVKGDAE